ncbi:MAG: VOC family protein [Deltaproteobacteria bacterium]
MLSKPISKTTEQRRSSNPIRCVHHHAFRTNDMEATRKFWEDLLGMPLIGVFVETTDPVTEKPSNYMHAFFELGDGNALAFFQFQEGLYKETAIQGNQDPFDHHVALEVDTKDDVLKFKEKVEAAGVDCMLIDHGYCYSVYMHDPNGMQVELTSRVDKSEEVLEAAAQTAHEDLKKWLAGVTEANNKFRKLRNEAS